MTTPNYYDSEESFDGFDSDDINDSHNRANEIGESHSDISSIRSSDDASSQLDFESTVKNDNDNGEQLVMSNPV